MIKVYVASCIWLSLNGSILTKKKNMLSVFVCLFFLFRGAFGSEEILTPHFCELALIQIH